jgi:hypothetical protein
MFVPDRAPDPELQAQLHKRFSLNLLIQGAAAHTYVTAHHLVRDELERVQPGIVRLYDKLAVNLHLSQWLGDMFLFLGRPGTFWKNVSKPGHPFYGHAFLMKHGPALARAAYEKTVRRAKKVHTPVLPGVQYAETVWLLGRTAVRERHHRPELESLCIRATSQMWGIEPERLTGRLTSQVEFGKLQVPETRTGRMLRAAAAGYGGVVRLNGRFQVVARAWIWPLLAHELTKGTAELVCLHGLAPLDDEAYTYVTDIADRIEHEIWMIQAGGELWRKFLAAIPRGVDGQNVLAHALMHVARMEPEMLGQFLMDLVEHPLTARGTLADLFESGSGQ